MHDHLLEQARELAELDPGKPKQASLRRSVSTAYYGLFHFLIDQSCRSALGAQHSQRQYRHVLGRAFSHSSMKNACESFAGGTLKTSVRKGLPSTFRIPPQVMKMAAVFVDLQNARHLADYDLTHRLTRKDVLTLVQQAATAVDDFHQLGTSDEKSFFLACLWGWNSLANR